MFDIDNCLQTCVITIILWKLQMLDNAKITYEENRMLLTISDPMWHRFSGIFSSRTQCLQHPAVIYGVIRVSLIYVF